MEFLAVRDVNFVFLPQLQALYESAFPAAERRRFEQLLLLLHKPDMNLQAVVKEDEFLGLFVYWELEHILYLEHLAVMPRQRGRGTGKAIMTWLHKQAAGKQLVLEVERPTSDINRKRISFYQKLGLELHHDFDYHQPPYERVGQQVPLFLMSAPVVTTHKYLLAIADLIRVRVYESHYQFIP